MLTQDQWIDILGCLLSGATGLLLALNRNLRRERRDLRQAYKDLLETDDFRRKQIVDDRQHYDQLHDEQQDHLRECFKLIRDNTATIGELRDQLEATKKIHLN
ncbi:hypothetical protein [Spirosoma arcticum]